MNHVSLSFSKQASTSSSNSPSNRPSNRQSHSPPKQPAPAAQRPTDLSNLLTTPRTPQPLDDDAWSLQARPPDSTPMEARLLVNHIARGLYELENCLRDPHCLLWRVESQHQAMATALHTLMTCDKTAAQWQQTHRLLVRFKQQCERAQVRYPHPFEPIERDAWLRARATYRTLDAPSPAAHRARPDEQALTPPMPTSSLGKRPRLSAAALQSIPRSTPHPGGFDTACQMQALALDLKRALDDNTRVDQAVLALRRFQSDHPQAPVAGWIVQLQWSAFDRLAERWPTPLPF
ncbi:MAG: hypothetical protein IBJ04_12075 [Hydrogenophaga sp.]|uniref:hypothetical protein n=1 Tax=Hydrogenophaga sp. TaxID=1904254 RepID=UPI00257CEB51|nr:hypothetical protein [Hydrogenophaga sp.]MBL0945057.1 hypothetical protein [Hydrogenophaga sp.]